MNRLIYICPSCGEDWAEPYCPKCAEEFGKEIKPAQFQNTMTTPRTDARKFLALPDGNFDKKLECVFASDYAKLETELIALREEYEKHCVEILSLRQERDQLLATNNQLKQDLLLQQAQHDKEWAEHKSDEDLTAENTKLLATVEGLKEALRNVACTCDTAHNEGHYDYCEKQKAFESLQSLPPTNLVKRSVLASIADKLLLLQIGACNCMTKTPEIKFHNSTCGCRIAKEAYEEAHEELQRTAK